MTIPIVPALIRLHALLSRTNFHFLLLLLHPVQVPDMVVHPLRAAFGLFRNIVDHKGRLFIFSMGHNVYFADLDLTPAQNVVLKRGVPNELLVNFARILDFVEVISAIRLFQNINGAIVIVIDERCLTDYRRSFLQVLRCFGGVLAAVAFLSGICVPGRYTVISS